MSDLERFKELLADFELPIEVSEGQGEIWVVTKHPFGSDDIYWVFTDKGAFVELTGA